MSTHAHPRTTRRRHVADDVSSGHLQRQPAMPTAIALLLLLAAPRGVASRWRGRGRHDSEVQPTVVEGGIELPSHWSQAKRREILEAAAAEKRERDARAKRGQRALPLFPTHNTMCEGRSCRPGEGNMKHDMERTKAGTMRFKQWAQPYEHREAYVQSRARVPPHAPDAAHYGGLVRVAQRVASGKLVLLTSGDWDYRGLVWNWLAHAKLHGHANALVLSMDSMLHEALTAAGAASFDNSANIHAWNATCMQRHIQAVRTERHVAAAAIVASGLDVLHMDATAVIVRPIAPYLDAELPAEVDVALQRDDWPSGPVRQMGTAANAGLMLLRAKNANDVVRLIMDAVNRGMIEFYLRWNNIADQYGWSFVLSESGVRLHTSEDANETSVGTIKRWHCMQQGGTCLKVAFLPHDRFPRHGRWVGGLDKTALVYHMTIGCVQESAPCGAPGIRTFRGNRQRLDRYDDGDFDGMVSTLRAVGAWRVGERERPWSD